jgi:hypothetical protein
MSIMIQHTPRGERSDERGNRLGFTVGALSFVFVGDVAWARPFCIKSVL